MDSTGRACRFPDGILPRPIAVEMSTGSVVRLRPRVRMVGRGTADSEAVSICWWGCRHMASWDGQGITPSHPPLYAHRREGEVEGFPLHVRWNLPSDLGSF